MDSPLFEIITNKIIQSYQPEKIIAFGSYANGTQKEDSDIDLVIVKKTEKRFYTRITEVLKIFRNFPNRPALDIIVYTPEELVKMNQVSFFIKDEVLNKGKVIYERKG